MASSDILDAAYGPESAAAPTAPPGRHDSILDAAYANESSKKDEKAKNAAPTDGEKKDGFMGFVNGLGELGGKSIANIPHAAAHAGVDLFRRWTGGDTSAPDPSLVQSLDVPLSQNAQNVGASIGVSLDKAAAPYQNPLATRVLNSDLVKNDVLPVVGDVGALAPVAGAVKGVIGMTRGVPGAVGERASVAAADTATAADADKFATDTKAAPQADGSDAEARAAVLRSVGFDKARISALNNDGPSGMSEYQTSRDPTTSQGAAAKQVFDNEKATLNKHAESIIDSTGGSKGLDEATREARGNTILKPFEDLQEHFDTQRKAAYAAADEKAGTTGINLKSFGDELNDESNLTNTDRHGLKSGLTAYLKKNNMLAEDGSISGNGLQAETVRKYINENWSPANSKFAGKLKDSLDDDVTKSAGDDTYKQARSIVTQQKNTLENPDGIAKILDASGPNGINRKVPTEKVADSITAMPNAQLKHITDTLDNMPAELQPQAQAAKAELQAHMASRLQEAGTKTADAWNHKEVNKYMDNNSAKLAAVFGKDSPQLQDMKNLRAAGNILRVDRSYPGAAIQGRILDKGLAGVAAAAGTGIGGTVGHYVGAPGLGASAGAAAGGWVGKKILQGAGARSVDRRMVDITKKQD